MVANNRGMDAKTEENFTGNQNAKGGAKTNQSNGACDGEHP